jgi:hypothetical protein
MDMVHILREYMNGVFVKLKRYHRTQFYRKYLSPQAVPPHPIWICMSLQKYDTLIIAVWCIIVVYQS